MLIKYEREGAEIDWTIFIQQSFFMFYHPSNTIQFFFSNHQVFWVLNNYSIQWYLPTYGLDRSWNKILRPLCLRSRQDQVKLLQTFKKYQSWARQHSTFVSADKKVDDDDGKNSENRITHVIMNPVGMMTSKAQNDHWSWPNRNHWTELVHLWIHTDVSVCVDSMCRSRAAWFTVCRSIDTPFIYEGSFIMTRHYCHTKRGRNGDLATLRGYFIAESRLISCTEHRKNLAVMITKLILSLKL